MFSPSIRSVPLPTRGGPLHFRIVWSAVAAELVEACRRRGQARTGEEEVAGAPDPTGARWPVTEEAAP
jgi:hypothetical protein